MIKKKETKLSSPIIFFGTGRSGTSIISEVCMRHKDLGFPSQYQMKFPNNELVNYLRRIFDNSIWRFHGQKKQLNKLETFNRYVFRNEENYAMWDRLAGDTIDFSFGFLIDTKATRESAQRIRKYFKKLVKRQGKKRLAFKITGPSRLEYLLSIFPDAKLVRIHREPIPTISSLLKVHFWQDKGAKKLRWKGAYSEDEIEWVQQHKLDPVAMTAFQLKKIIDTTDEEIKKLGVDVFNVQYGSFLKNPQDTIKSILEYTCLTHDKACYNYFVKNKVYNRNKQDNDYFEADDLDTIRKIFA